MSDRFDFEQQILKCWNVTDDIRELSEHYSEFHDSNFTKDKVANSLNGLAELYDIKFDKLWGLFEDVFMQLVRDEKMAREEANALREQLMVETQGYNVGKPTLFGKLDTQGFGIMAIKPNKKGK
jgi:hypothetical protein